nr:alpha/beta hydrolase [Candidatus Sigynarchaeota archaeon]
MAIKKYQLVLTLVFLGMTLVGAIGLNTYPADLVRETHGTVASDGVYISFNLYHKAGIPDNCPVIVIGHGIMVNKEYMSNFAIEIAARGNFLVASLDWRGEGQSGGAVSNSLYLDLEAVINIIPSLMPTANMSAIGLVGFSMGGGPTFQYAVNHTEVRAWVGVATTPDGNVGNTTNPKNVLAIKGEDDEAFSSDRLLTAMMNLTNSASISDVLVNHEYGSIAAGTARKIKIIPLADHLTATWDPIFTADVTDWMVRTFYGITPDLTFMVYHIRVILLLVGLTGLVGIVYGIALLIARAEKFHNTVDAKAPAGQGKIAPALFKDLSTNAFVGRYYAWTLGLIPTVAIPAASILIPMFLTSIMVILNGWLAINLLIYSWRLLKKRGCSVKKIIMEDLAQKKAWILGAIITPVFVTGFYFMVGMNYLGSMPPVPRFPFVIIYGVTFFVLFYIFAFFNEQITASFVKSKSRFKDDKVTYVVQSLVSFGLIYSWFFAIIMTACALMQSMFFAIFLILMIPIFLFMAFAGNYLHRLTLSSVPNALLQSVLITLLVVTLSPIGSMFGAFMHF